MRTEGNVEIAENHLYLDGWLRGDRTNINSTGRIGIGGLTGTEDDTEFYSVGLSPYLTARLGDFALVEFRFTGDKVGYSEDVASDSTGKAGAVAFGSGSMFTNQAWEVLFKNTEVDYESLDENNETTIFRSELIQKITNQWALAFSAGYEEYDLVVTEDRDDSTWSVGFIYTPNPRTRIALGVGERSFGDDYYFDFSHRSSRTIWTARYEQDFTSAREELRVQPLFERQDAFGDLRRDPILEGVPISVRGAFNPSVTEAYFESKRFSTAFTYLTARTTFVLSGGYLERIYNLSIRDTEDIEMDLLLERKLSRLLTGLFRIGYYDHEQEALVYDQWLASLGTFYQIGTDGRIGLDLSRIERDADAEGGSYTENQVSVNFTVAL
jgi:uncharacterized protein (PEP-CTERM system associated)